MPRRERPSGFRAKWRTAGPLAAVLAMCAPLVPPVPSAQQPATGQTAPGGPASRGSPFVPPEPLDYNDHAGWISLFDGATLKGWDGNPAVWKVEQGAIVAESTAESRVGSTYLIWQGGEVADFELKLEVKLDGDIHSGIAYRSFVDPTRASAGAAGRQGPPPTAGAAAPAAVPARGRTAPPQIPADPRWTLYGPGLDFDYDRQMAGNVEDRGTPRREVAWRGSVVRAEASKPPRVIGSLGDADALMALVVPDAWNQLHIVARGHQLTHIINGRTMAILIDDDPTFFKAKGLIGLSIEQFGVGRVNVRNIWLKQ